MTNDWSQAEQHAERAHQHYEAGQWDKALAELRLALACDPGQSDWHFGMGLTLDALQRYEDAIKSFEEVLRLRGHDDLETLLHLAIDLIRTDRCERAVETLEQASQADPDYEPAYCHRVLAYAKLGDHEQAEAMFYLARQISDECPICYDHLAQSLQARGQTDKAIWCWQQTLKCDPYYPDVHANLGRVYWRRGQLEKAYFHFLQQVREDPGDRATLLEMGYLLTIMGRQQEAGEKFRRVLELDPADAAAHHHLGELALMSGHLDAAKAQLEMSHRLDPERPGVQLGLAQIAQRRGETEAARSHLRRELDREGHYPTHLLEIARLLVDLRVPQPAVGLLTPMIEEARERGLSETRLASAYFYRGVAQLVMGRTHDGVRDCRRAVKLSPEHTLAMQNLIVAHLQQRRLTRARYWLRRALEHRPTDPQLRQLVYRVLRARIKAGVKTLGQRLNPSSIFSSQARS